MCPNTHNIDKILIVNLNEFVREYPLGLDASVGLKSVEVSNVHINPIYKSVPFVKN